MRNEISYKEIWDQVFTHHELDDIPWITRNIDEPIKKIISEIGNNQSDVCSAFDIGCGIGTLSEFLSSKYKDVTAIGNSN